MDFKYCLIVLLMLTTVAGADKPKWQLEQNGEFAGVQSMSNANFINDMITVKKFVSTGKVKFAKNGYAKLKDTYPEIAGEDFDSFVEAEILYAKRNYASAARAYNNFMNSFPDSKLSEAAIERMHAIATAFLTGEKISVLRVFRMKAYDEGAEIMNSIAEKTGDAPAAQKALSSLAEYTERRGAYEEAYHVWADIAERWPTGYMGRESLYGMANSLRMAYRGPQFDSTVLDSSRSYYVRFKQRYPEEPRTAGVTNTIVKIDSDLAEKNFEIAKYYERTDHFDAARFYYQLVTIKWTGTNSAIEAKKKLAKLDEIETAKKNAKKRLRDFIL